MDYNLSETAKVLQHQQFLVIKNDTKFEMLSSHLDKKSIFFEKSK